MRLRLNPTLITIALLLLTTATVLAQEEAAAEVETAPPGISMLLLLGGLGAVALVGYVMSRREAASEATSSES